MTTRMLVLGGEGFLGLNIMHHLSQSQSFDCTSVDIKKSPFDSSPRKIVQLDPYCDSIDGQYDIAVHCIDHVLTPSLFKLAEKALMEKLLQTEVTCIVLLSSSVMYADSKSAYAERKKLLENMYANFCKIHGISLIILRIFNTYGPFQIPYRPGSLVANLIYNHLRQESTEIKDMSAKRDFIYSQDISKFVEYAVRNQIEGTFDVGSGMLYSIEEFIAVLEKDVFKHTIDIVNKDIAEGVVCPPAHIGLFDSIRLTELSVALNETVTFYIDNMNLLKKYVERPEK